MPVASPKADVAPVQIAADDPTTADNIQECASAAAPATADTIHERASATAGATVARTQTVAEDPTIPPPAVDLDATAEDSIATANIIQQNNAYFAARAMPTMLLLLLSLHWMPQVPVLSLVLPRPMPIQL